MATIESALVEFGRTVLRINSPAMDEEIEQTLGACLMDLKSAGVVAIDPTDALVKQACKLYLKGFFGYDSNAERFQQSYEYLKRSMSLYGKYSKGGEDGTD